MIVYAQGIVARDFEESFNEGRHQPARTVPIRQHRDDAAVQLGCYGCHLGKHSMQHPLRNYSKGFIDNAEELAGQFEGYAKKGPEYIVLASLTGVGAGAGRDHGALC